jgi:hypothetical protein
LSARLMALAWTSAWIFSSFFFAAAAFASCERRIPAFGPAITRGGITGSQFGGRLVPSRASLATTNSRGASSGGFSGCFRS